MVEENKMNDETKVEEIKEKIAGAAKEELNKIGSENKDSIISSSSDDNENKSNGSEMSKIKNKSVGDTNKDKNTHNKSEKQDTKKEPKSESKKPKRTEAVVNGRDVRISTKHAVAVNSGTAALHSSLYAAGIMNGDEVITTPFTFVATANAVASTGAKPIFVDILSENLEEGFQYFPADQITDHPERFLVSEMIREKVLHLTREEIPHSVAVVVDSMKRDEETDKVHIRATIMVERDSQKGIVIGKQGSMLKEVGKRSRVDIENLLGSKVYLELWVKVQKDWRNRSSTLRDFGFSDDEY